MVMASGSVNHSQMLRELDLTLMKVNTTLTKNTVREFLSGSREMYIQVLIMKMKEMDMVV